MHCPALGKVPSQYSAGSSTATELSIKATHTGITFLGNWDDEYQKYIVDRTYKKRYTGSKQTAVDINGRLWLRASDLDAELKGEQVQSAKGREALSRKKKGSACPPNPKLFYEKNIEPQISEENLNPENFAPEIAQKVRKKSYSVNKREIRQRIYGYLNTQKGKKHLYFWTVSFPAGTPDDTCYQAFNTWLTSLRKYRMIVDYLWVAERQTGDRLETDKTPTNTLHFHLLIPRYLDVHKANAMMRGTLKNLARKGLLPYSEHSRQIKKYNGVDIAKNRKTKRVVNFAIKKGSRALATYVTKYVTKNDTEFSHLAWHNSRGFSALFTGVTFTIKEFNDLGFGPFLNKVRVFKMNFALFIPWLFGPPPLLEKHLYDLNSYIQHLNDESATVRSN